jgi:hypothetical protein
MKVFSIIKIKMIKDSEINVCKKRQFKKLEMRETTCKLTKVLITALLFMLCLTTYAEAASYTVCDSGCDYTKIANAVNALTNGTANTITIKNPYSANERVTVNKAGASDSNRVVIIADTGYTPVTKGFSVTANYVTVSGFEMAACGAAICAVTSANYTSFLNNDIHGSNGSGEPYEIGTDDTNNYRTYLVIQGNKIHAGSGRSSYTLLNFRANYSLIDSNEIYSCVDCDAIHFWGHDSVISNNYIHDLSYGNGGNHSDHFQTFGDGGYVTMYNYVIEKNVCISTGADLQPFNLSNDSKSGIHDLIIRNNIFMYFGTQGNIGVPNTSVYNNTFIDVGANNEMVLNMLYGGGFDDTGALIKNNIFLLTYNQDPFNVDARTTHTNNHTVRCSGSTYYTVTGWSETGGVMGQNPLFKSYTLGTHTCGTYNFSAHSCKNFDLHLTSTSPGKDTGADLSGVWSNATDIVGTSRPQNSGWDIGAYEYVSETSQYTLTVSKSGTGSGTVTSSPSGINCGSTCSAGYDGGTVVTLTATPSGSDTFAGWGGACAGTGACTVTMDAEKAVTVTFNTPPPPSNYNLSIVKSGTGTGTISSSPSGIDCGSTCTTAYTDGTTVTLTATPASGHSFSGWSGGGCSGTESCVVTVSADTTITATFAPPPPVSNFNFTVTKSGTGSGTVSSSPSGIDCGSTCSATYTGGTTVTLTVTPDSGHSFVGWSGGGCSGTGSCISTVNADTTVTATFTPPPQPNNYHLTTLKSGKGTGTVSSSPSGIDCGSSCSATYTAGTTVTLAAAPDTGKTFAGWSGGGCSGKGTCVVNANADTTVTATFTIPVTKGKKRLTILTSGTGMGILLSSPAGVDCGTSCEGEYDEGTVVTLTEKTSKGHSFVGWSGGGCSGTGACVVTMNTDTTVTAKFSYAGGSGGGGCFIATAAYGSYLDPHVYVLRNFRDKYLLTNSLGKAIVNFYYQFSPPMADYIRNHETLRIATRWALTPIVCGIKHPSILLILPAGLLVWKRRFKRQS